MMGYTEFKRVSSDPAIRVDIARFYDNKYYKKNRLDAHDIGWTIKVVEPGKPWAFGYFHVHWAPKNEYSEVNHNISAHFKESHKSNKTLNRSGASADLKPLDAALMYTGFCMLEAVWDARSPNAPNGAPVGWTSLATTITKQMVDDFKANHNTAALKALGQNPLYDLSKWEKEAWTSYMWWMAGA